MKKSTRDVVSVIVLGLAAMFALPVAYRVWIHYNPPPTGKSFSDVLREAGGVRRAALLSTPLDKWSEADVKLAPDIREWLAAHSEVILPWEWSEEARKKDWTGYCDAWQGIVKEQSAALDELIDGKAGAMEDAAGRARMMRDAAGENMAQVTNLLAAARAARSAETNAYPLLLSVSEVVPGRLWGVNRDRKKLRFDDEASLLSFADELDARTRREWTAEAERLEQARDRAKADIAELSRAKDGLSAVRGEMAEAARSGCATGGPGENAARRLLEAIVACYRHRMPDGGRLRWLPGRVRRWFGASDEDGREAGKK